jgi:hypothetical protein
VTSFAFRADSALAGLGGNTSPWSPADRPAPRQRSKLWELNGGFHCSIIGTCLTTAELRRTMGKLEGIDVSGLTDHELHSRARGRIRCIRAPRPRRAKNPCCCSVVPDR